MHEGTEQDVKMLETALAYMETPWCEKWFHPMEAWTATRVFLIIVHARAAQHPLMKSYDWDSYRDLIAHVTPYRREPEALDMWTTIAGLARLAKQFFPTVRLVLTIRTILANDVEGNIPLPAYLRAGTYPSCKRYVRHPCLE